MDLLEKTKTLLARPFPQEENWTDTLKIVGAISLFVFVFLYVFKPFGMHLAQGKGYFLLCFGFALVAFIASMVYEFIALKIIRIKISGPKFTFSRWILYFAGAMIMISFANFIFVRLVLFGNIEWPLYFPMLKGTFAIGLFPAIFFGAVAVLKKERKYQNIATEINQKGLSCATKPSALNETIFGITIAKIQYVEAMQNYVRIGYLSAENGQLEHIERATIASVSKELVSDNILRCHRSFLVNRNFIKTSTGNAQGLTLSLTDCEKKIPVSRSFVADFKN